MDSRSGEGVDLDVFGTMPLDTESISQARLNISVKERGNLFPWNGQFSPQLVEAVLRRFAQPRDLVLDPSFGSGTVLCEAGRLGLRCFGTEINPAALKMAQTYRFINVNQDEKDRVFQRLDRTLQEVFPDPLPMFFRSQNAINSGELKRSLVDLSENIGDEPAKVLLDTLIVLLDFYKNDLCVDKVFETWEKLQNKVGTLPFSEAAIGCSNDDARTLPLPESSVDFVLTSPPYINVFNYHQQYRASVEALGWDLLKVARSEIGSNRRHRSNRFLTVVQYCLDMTDVLLELRRVCKPDSRIVIVVGRESNVRKTRFFNGEIIAALGGLCAGLVPLARQERVFKNRFGLLIYEDVLHFKTGETSNLVLVEPLEVARLVSARAMAYAPEESEPDLIAALESAPAVRRSPPYHPGEATKAQPAALKGNRCRPSGRSICKNWKQPSSTTNCPPPTSPAWRRILRRLPRRRNGKD